MSQPTQPPPTQVGRLINLIPVGLKEAAIDSPTSRATFLHFSDQIDLVEKWLEDYMKSTNRLITESMTLEIVLNNFLSHAIVPTTVSESVLDHDYTILAMRKYSESAKDFWMTMVTMVKRLTISVVEPIRLFLHNDIRNFKDVRRNLEQAQKTFDTLQNKYAALGKTKEPSFLREEAFQLHEARRLYLKASMDFFSLTPQLRFNLDKLIVRIFSEQWRDMRSSRDNAAASMQRNAQDMDRVQGWVREMESSEQLFRKELIAARKQLEDAAESSHRPSRELEDYANSTVPHMGGPGALQRSPKKAGLSNGEKQGWLYLKTYTGRPTRIAWIKRWAFVRNGIFGWLVQGTRAGGVEESERIGVLLCNARPAPTEERRFCFEIKTNRNTIFLQAETQSELASWLSTFETAKSKALEDPGASDTLASSSHAHSDPAFAISAPPVPEFGTSVLPLLEPGATDEGTLDRSGTLPIPSSDMSRESTDVSRHSMNAPGDEGGGGGGGGREHASRIKSKLDAVRKSSANPQSAPSSPAGGIASLIAASHGSMPVGPSIPWQTEPEQIRQKSTFRLALRDMPPSSLAPSTLANPPAATSLSKTAVAVTGERGISGAIDKTGIPNGLLANTWGSSNMSFINRLERGDPRVAQGVRTPAAPTPFGLAAASPITGNLSSAGVPDLSSMSTLDLSVPRPLPMQRSRTPSPDKMHRSTISLDADSANKARAAMGVPDFPNYYPLQLKTQDAQFRLLFPSVRRDERLVMVFRASWDPNEQQDFPGRVYVTTKEIYFYSHHLGLVLTSGVSLSSIDEVTAAPGRECDFLFLHMVEGIDDGSPARITIKTFLEPLRLLQRRLNFLVRNSIVEQPLPLEDVIKSLLRMESEIPERSPSLESWEDVAPDTPVDSNGQRHRARASTIGTELKAPIRVDRSLGTHGHMSTTALGEKVAKFKLPAQPVVYIPPGNLRLAVEKHFDISPKALFHILFGDRSAVWQLLQHERRVQNVKQGPWIPMGEGRLRRDFQFSIPTSDTLGRETITEVQDYQAVDVTNDHLCYVVTDKRTAWHLPYRRNFRLVSKIVITHVAKGRCKLAVFIKIEWLQHPWMLKAMIEQQALSDLELDALDLADVAADQVRRLGVHSRTKKAVQIYGPLGQSTEITQLHVGVASLNIEMRSMPVRRTAIDLMKQGVTTAAESAAGTLFKALVDLIQWVWKTSNANVFILALLLASVLYNGWHSSRDGMTWWHERNAAKFMNRLGVKPNTVLSKAVYVSDLDTVLANTGLLPDPESSVCYSVFYDEYQLDAEDFDTLEPGVSRAKQQIQRTRQKLGNYRHDLLVAMRVVDSVEKELVLSEWEQWLLSESRRCRQVRDMLNVTGSETEVVDGKDVQLWYDEYCGSCQTEHERLRHDKERSR